MVPTRRPGPAQDGPGLRRRMQRAARSISEQHRQLDALYGDLLEALERVDGHRARLVFLRLGDALNAHFSLEESFFFPAVHGLHPAAGAELGALSLEHERFDADLARISDHLRGDRMAAAASDLDRLATALAAHEKREEALVRALITRKEH